MTANVTVAGRWAIGGKQPNGLRNGLLTLCLLAATAITFPAATAKKSAPEDKGAEKSSAAEKAPVVPEIPPPSAAAQESQKLLKTLKTPFGLHESSETETQSSDPLSSFTLAPEETRPRHLSLNDRLMAAQMYLPGHMTIGHTCEFTVKGKPGCFVALAMADRNSGAKPVVGHTVRLGPDRKVVAAAEIPASGVAVLSVDTPIEGDLVGQCLYFEAVLWSKSDFSDTEVATVIPSETHDAGINGVMIAADTGDKKKGLRIVPDSSTPMSRVKSGEGL